MQLTLNSPVRAMTSSGHISRHSMHNSFIFIYLLQFNGIFAKNNSNEKESPRDNLQNRCMTPYLNKSPHKNFKNCKKNSQNCYNIYSFVTNLITSALNLPTGSLSNHDDDGNKNLTNLHI